MAMNDTLSLATLRAALVARKAEIAAEIRHYPGPIPGCDAQFNRLLEIRRILAQELLRLDSLADDGISATDLSPGRQAPGNWRKSCRCPDAREPDSQIPATIRHSFRYSPPGRKPECTDLLR